MRTLARRARAPIALQLVALLVVCLIAAQVLTIAVIVMMPPPARPVYHLDDVAQALRGGAVPSTLIRSVETEAPQADHRGGGHLGRMRHELAVLVGTSDAEVRLIQHPSFTNMLFRRPRGLGPRENDVFIRQRFGEGPGEARVIHGVAGFGPPEGGPAGFPGREPFPAMSGRFPLFGDFTAAARRKGGDWVVVKTRPEPFPNDWQGRLLLWLGGCLILTAPVGYLFARRITAPIGAFAHAAETLGRDPSGPLMELSGPAEVGMAARAFNEMQARLKRYIEDRTAMVGAISHDMRTPLARIRFKLERASPEVKAAVLGDVEQMEQMITSVLAFIRDGNASRPRERLELLSLVECLVDDAAQGGQDVRLEAGTTVTVQADALGLQRLFGNLVDNAVKYGRVAKLSVSRHGDEAVVDVADEGPGLPASEIERVFLPFYRAELARTLDGRGVGLGLAVARSIARAHGGDVTLVSGPGGLIARVRLPLSAA
jgi:two-component system OmpR family sensor kinase